LVKSGGLLKKQEQDATSIPRNECVSTLKKQPVDPFTKRARKLSSVPWKKKDYQRGAKKRLYQNGKSRRIHARKVGERDLASRKNGRTGKKVV